MSSVSRDGTGRRRQSGAAIVEFALIAIVFFALLLGIMEFGRWLFTLNGASEATRWAARLAVVCDNSTEQKDKIKQKVASVLRGVRSDQIEITYLPSDSCTSATCTDANVFVKDGTTFSPLIPFLGRDFLIPPFSVTLPREAMSSAGNDACPI